MSDSVTFLDDEFGCEQTGLCKFENAKFPHFLFDAFVTMTLDTCVLEETSDWLVAAFCELTLNRVFVFEDEDFLGVKKSFVAGIFI